jgi:hypothetical protein
MGIEVTTQQKVYNPAGQHVGTVHKKNGEAYSGSWIVVGAWQHGNDLVQNNAHIGGYGDLAGAKDHRYGADGFVSVKDNRKYNNDDDNNSGAKPGGNPYGGSGGTGVGAGAAPGLANLVPAAPAPPAPPSFDANDSIIELAKDRADEFRNDNGGGGDFTNITEKNNSIVSNIEQNIGNKGDKTINNNPVDSDQTYASIGNDYSLNLGYVNDNDTIYS